MDSQRQWVDTGHGVEVPGQVDRVPDYDPRSGDHLWAMFTAFRVDPAMWTDMDHTPMLDGENLLTIAGPACYYCEHAWTPTLATRRCKGKP